MPSCAQTSGGRAPFLTQVRFVAICERGHLQDFPWQEWVHGLKVEKGEMTVDQAGLCPGPLRLRGGSSATLAGIRVSCDHCGASRTLSGVTGPGAKTDSGKRTTFLSSNMFGDGGPPFTCQGKRPWTGTGEGEACGEHLLMALRGASNIYFAQQRSAIYLPRSSDIVPAELVTLLEDSMYSPQITWATGLNLPVDQVVTGLRVSGNNQLLLPYSDEQLSQAIDLKLHGTVKDVKGVGSGTSVLDDEETAFRRAEYEALRSPRQEEVLTIREGTGYSPDFARDFSRVMLIDRLRETRVLTGFTRVVPEGSADPLDRRRRMDMLWETPRESS